MIPRLTRRRHPRAFSIRAIRTREYKYYRTRWGSSGAVDYKLNDFNDIYIKGIYSEIKDYSGRGTLFAIRDAAKFYTSQKSPEYSIGSINMGGHHYMNSAWISWEVAASRSFQTASAGNPKADLYRPQTDLAATTRRRRLTGAFRRRQQLRRANFPLLNPSNRGFADITTSGGISAQLNLWVPARIPSYTSWVTAARPSKPEENPQRAQILGRHGGRLLMAGPRPSIR